MKLKFEMGMQKGYAYGFKAVESACIKVEARGVARARPLLPDDIQSQITKIIGYILFEKMQEASREWEQKIAYGVHIISEWAARYFADLGYRSEDIPRTDLQPSPEWKMRGESSQEDAQKDGQEDGDHHAPPS